MKHSHVLLLAIVCLTTCVFAFPHTLRLEKYLEASNQFVRKTRQVEGACLKISCATQGESCGFGIGSLAVCITPGYPLCNETCVALLANEQPCSSSSSCVSDYCSAGTCATLPIEHNLITNGNPCTADSQCYSEICIDGVCIGGIVGIGCNSDLACADNLFCNTTGSDDHCAVSIPVGGACSLDVFASRTQCSGPYICGVQKANGVFSGTCRALFSGVSGTYCSDSTECGDGLACLPSTTEAYGQCGAAAASSKAACSADADCTAPHESCECDYGAGASQCVSDKHNIPTGLTASYNAAEQCLTDKCTNDVSEACAKKNCLVSYCNFQKMKLSYTLTSYGTFPQCLISAELTSNPDCAGVTSTAPSSLHFIQLLVVLVTLFVSLA